MIVGSSTFEFVFFVFVREKVQSRNTGLFLDLARELGRFSARRCGGIGSVIHSGLQHISGG